MTDTDAMSHDITASKKIFKRITRGEKIMYKETCLELNWEFTPLVYSVGSLACKEACSAEKWIASFLVGK